MELLAEEPLDERRHVDAEIRTRRDDVPVDARLDLAIEEAVVLPRWIPPGAVTPGHVRADEADGALGLLARGIQPQSPQELEDVERVGPILREGVAGPEPIRSLERQQPGAPALGGDARPLGGDDRRRLVREVLHHLPADRGIRVEQPIDDGFGHSVHDSRRLAQDTSHVRFRAILGLSAALLVACSAGSTTSSVPGSSPPATSIESSPRATPSAVEPTASAAESASTQVLVGGDRPVAVHVPPEYDSARPAPLLIVLHGYGSSGPEHDAYFHLGEAAAERGFLYAYPDGTIDGNGNHFWNATDACCDFDRAGVDDAAYLARVIGDIQASFAVDPKRIDLIGHSNGGFMSYAMACANADMIAAMVSLAGATFVDRADCAPTVPVAVLEIHGTADDTITYEGGTIDLGSGPSMAPYPGAKASVTTWATYDGCATSSVVDEHVDVDAHVSVDGAPAEAEVMRWTGCRPGGAAELWTIPGGGHAPDISESFPAAVLDFFEAHPKP